jgi:hypothetical protein
MRKRTEQDEDVLTTFNLEKERCSGSGRHYRTKLEIKVVLLAIFSEFYQMSSKICCFILGVILLMLAVLSSLKVTF